MKYQQTLINTALIALAMVIMHIPILALPSPPNLLSPLNGAVTVSLEGSTYWQSVAGADAYHLQIATDATFTNLVIDKDDISATQYCLCDITLDYYTTYYWRVSTIDDGVEGNFSASRQFETEKFLDAPQLVSPLNNSFVVKLKPYYDWNTVNLANKYKIETAIDSNFVIIIESKTINQDYFTALSDLEDGLSVYWRVKAIANSGEESAWSETRLFTVDLLDSPQLNSPLTDAILDDMTPEFSWQPVNAAESYDVHISDVSDFSNIVVALNPAQSPTSAAEGDLEAFTQYYWRVRAKADGEVSDWSDGRGFEIRYVEAVSLTYPADNQTEVEHSPTFTWTDAGNADSYIFQIATDDLFTNLVDDKTGITAETYDLSQGLSPYTTYFWRVKAVKNATESQWAAASFKTDISDVPASWQPQTTGITSTISVPISITQDINGRNFEDGDAIGAFFDDGGTPRCAGFQTWNGSNLEITITGDDPLTPGKEGFADGEEYFFRVWDARLASELTAAVEYSSGNDYFTDGATSTLSLVKAPDVSTLSINLIPGWNFISSNVDPEAPALETVFAANIGEFIVVKNQNGKIYAPDFGINQIGDWNVGEAYYVYAISAFTLDITGEKVDYKSTPLSLSPAWNFISYFPEEAIDIETALANFDGSFLIVRSDNKIYAPDYGINQIGDMQTTRGYMIYMIESKTEYYNDIE